jgi:hypothetical protein
MIQTQVRYNNNKVVNNHNSLTHLYQRQGLPQYKLLGV